MCGIFGVTNLDGARIALEKVVGATTSLRHRGPDDEGYLLVDTRSGKVILCGGRDTDPRLELPRIENFFGEKFDLALGFRRLSILDLSPHGHQPMQSADGRFWIVYNGEIYNYLELRDELSSLGHSFHTGTDTEVVLASYSQWGRDCLNRFNGMWGFAIWDNLSREIFLSRDRFGVKPLYYAWSADRKAFAFASEIKALLAAGIVAFKPSRKAIADYTSSLLLPSQSAGETFFEGVHSLPASHYGLLKSDRLTTTRYWSLPQSERTQNSTIRTINDYRELFIDAVRLRLRADVTIGSCLSGGLDSSSIVASIEHILCGEQSVASENIGKHQKTFSVVYNNEGVWNERPYIEKILEKSGAQGHFFIPSSKMLWQQLDKLVWHQEEPFSSTSIFARWCVMDLVSQHSTTVVLNGQGADEIFGGYKRVLPVYIKDRMNSAGILGSYISARQIVKNADADGIALFKWALKQRFQRSSEGTSNREQRSGLLREMEQSYINSYNIENAFDRFIKHQSFRDCLVDLIYEDSLPHILREEDRNSMAFSLEVRLPFLDYRLVEFVFKHGEDLCLRDGWTKWLHRKSVADMLPEEIVWRRDKVGFATPEQQWLSEEASQAIELLNNNSHASEYLDMDYVRRATADCLEVGVGDLSLVWRWINLASWLDAYSSTSVPA